MVTVVSLLTRFPQRGRTTSYAWSLSFCPVCTTGESFGHLQECAQFKRLPALHKRDRNLLQEWSLALLYLQVLGWCQGLGGPRKGLGNHLTNPRINVRVICLDHSVSLGPTPTNLMVEEHLEVGKILTPAPLFLLQAILYVPGMEPGQ